MKAMLVWRLHRDRGIALFILVALLLAAYRVLSLDRITLFLYLGGLSQAAFWGGLSLLFILYRRDSRAIGRGELGALLLLPQGPTRYALAQAAEFVLLTTFLLTGITVLGSWAAGRFEPSGASELARLGLYLFLAIGLPAVGGFQLATAMHAAYFLGRTGGLAATLVILGAPLVTGEILSSFDGAALWNWGPKVTVGSFNWLIGTVPGLSVIAPSSEWPAWPLALGILLFLACLVLSLSIYRETEL